MNAVQTLKLTKEFDGLVAVNGVDLEIKKGELFNLKWCFNYVMAQYGSCPPGWL